MSESGDALIARFGGIMKHGVEPRLRKVDNAINEGAIFILVTEHSQVLSAFTPNMDREMVRDILVNVLREYDEKMS